VFTHLEHPPNKSQGLLLDLLQFGCADLHFGICCMMNCKHGVAQEFNTQDRTKAVAEELQSGAAGLTDRGVRAIHENLVIG